MMQCPQCQANYQAENHIPRILIACGHTICEKCISASFNKQNLVNQSKYCFECPECQAKNEAESVLSFPKNIALINMSTPVQNQTSHSIQQNKQQPSHQKQQQHQSNSSRRQTHHQTQSAQGKQSQQEGVCKQHEKKIEAYCANDKQILCIDCILSDQHKSHEIASVQKAAENEREALTLKFKTSQELEFQLEELNKNIDGHTDMLRDQARKNAIDIQKIFEEVRAMIDEKERQILDSYQKVLQHEETYLEEKKTSNLQQIEIVRHFQDEWMKVGQEDEIQQLSLMKMRYELADQALVGAPKINFNHVFTEVKRETELLNLSKMLKAGKVTTNKTTVPSTPTQGTAVSSNYMSGTHSWQNKNKNPLPQQPPLQSQNSTNSQRAGKVGTSAIRSSSKDRRLMGNNNINTSKAKGTRQRSPLKDGGASASFNLAGSFNSNELIAGFQSQQAPTPSANKKMNDIISQSAHAFRNLNNQTQTSFTKTDQRGGNFDDFSKAFKSGTTAQTTANTSVGNTTPHQIPTKDTKKMNIIPAAPQNNNSGQTSVIPQVSPRPKTSSLYVTRGEVTNNTQKLNSKANNQSSENLLVRAATAAVGNKQPANLSEMRNKLKSQKNNALQSALQTQEDNLNMLQRYKTQIDSEKVAREDQDASTCNTSARQPELSSREQERKAELLQKALGLDKENNGLKSAKQQQKKRYLNQGAEAPKGKVATTVCQVNLTSNEKTPFEPASDIKKDHEDAHTSEFYNGNMSITKSMLDYYNQKASRKEDLMSLYRHETPYIYVISGFCDNSLGYVERLNIDKMEWEELMPVKIPRTKFTVVQGQKEHEIMILGGKDQDGQRTDSIETYNCYDNIWTVLPDVKLRKPRSGFAAISLKQEGKVFIIGGNDGRVQNRVECLNLSTKQWTKIAKMNMKRDELAACLGPDNKIYAIGGYGGGDNACLSSAERYDLDKGKWELIAPMKEARRALTAVALPDGIYAIGGYNGTEYVNTVERYDVFSNEWVQVKSMKQARCTLSAVASSDCQYIYAIGGFNGAPLNNIERYDVTKEEWESALPPMKQKRFMHSSIMVNI